MNLHHAAALALVGWYLMVPPAKNLSAPLREWKIIDSFDRADECRLDRKAFYEDGLNRTKNPKDESDFDLGKTFIACVCVETDDPRLSR
jgi:hypothetical protein